MRKIVIERPGAHDRLIIRQASMPAPVGDEVVVDVRAIGINYADVLIRMGLYQSAKDFVGWPITPGFEVAGVVNALGPDVTDLAVGDRVLAVTLFDGYATRVKVERRFVFRTPERLSDPEAAGFPAVFLTAYYALYELAHPRPGGHLLIHSAAGGVGGSLVQLGKVAGCTVTGVVGGTHKIDVARKQGADHVIDKSTEKLWQRAEAIAPDGFDVICDANGVATLGDSYKHLRRPGKLVVYGFHTMMPKKKGRPNWIKLITGYLRTPRFNPIDMTNLSRCVLAFNLSYMFAEKAILAEGMERLLGWLETGDITAPPVATYAFEEVAQAHRDIESGKTVGKLVLVP